MEISGYNVMNLVEQAEDRWLKTTELIFIIQNHDPGMISQGVPQQPTSGSLLLYNRNATPSFRGDGHNWRKKPNKNTVRETHERLMVDKVEALNCYYAKGEDNHHFMRRSYWMLDGANMHIVLVHYRDTTLDKRNPASTSTPSPHQPSTFTQSVSNLAIENEAPAASLSGIHGSSQSLCSPHSVEVNSSALAQQQRMEHFNNSSSADGNVSSSREIEQQDIDGTPVLGCDIVSCLAYHCSWQEIASLSACLELSPCETNIPDCYPMLPDPGQVQMPQLEADCSVTIIPEHKFEIREISPDWCFANEATKVIIIGSFHCDPSEIVLAKFDDIEVRAQIMQDGVICCQAPPNRAGKVNVCITSGNQEFCSEVKEFEFRDRVIVCNNCTRAQKKEYRSMEEVQLLVEFVHMLLPDSSFQKREGSGFNIDPSRTQKGYEDSVDYIIETLLTGCSTSSDTIHWILRELLKDKLQQWLCSRLLDVEGNLVYTLSDNEKGIIHIVAGLGYEWALDSVLGSGIGVNFRDTNGWTALHWAARFGRENMVAVLIANGASVRAITHPNTRDPKGKTPASIADAYGHKGLAGYLSELALTTHFSSLTFEEARAVHVEAEGDVSSIPTDRESVASAEDELCGMEKVLAARRNAFQAAKCIKTAFQAYSFRMRQQREAEAANRSKVVDDDHHHQYGFTAEEIAAAFSHSHKRNVAASAIQKHYRGWKRRNHFLNMRQKAVKIQAHIRGYQVRKKYLRLMNWAVRVLYKIVLRWCRRRVGLRDYKPIDENAEAEDIVRDFRRKNVEMITREDLERVCSMIDSRDARDQYSRMLETFRQANAKLVGVLTHEESLASLVDAFSMDSDNINAFQ